MKPSERFRILCRDGFRCRYCGARAPDAELQVDHVFPVSFGGEDDPDNLVTACRRCNIGKGAMLLPLVDQPNLIDLSEKIAKLLREYENAVEDESRWRMDEVLEEIRRMGAVVNELAGYHGMMRVYDWIEEREGFDLACHLEPHWNDIGEWTY